mgnify:CR=1 FL=1
MENTEKVLERALLFMHGELGKNGQERLALLCRLAAAELAGRLRKGVSTEEAGEQFISAAGILALSMYATLEEDALESVKIGSVSMTNRRGDLAQRLRELAEEILAGDLRQRGFDFRGVRG